MDYGMSDRLIGIIDKRLKVQGMMIITFGIDI